MKSVPTYLINKEKKSHSQCLNVNCGKTLLKITIFRIKRLFLHISAKSVIFSRFFLIVNIFILDEGSVLLIDMNPGNIFHALC
jgi:hypothetical protein